MTDRPAAVSLPAGTARQGRRRWVVPAVLGAVVLLAAYLRFYGLAWGAPYFHFHIDEHFVFVGAQRLRVSMEAAARSGKFFMYSPLPMYFLNLVVWAYEWARGSALVLTSFGDQVTYMVMGRAISATFGTATVVAVYFVGRRVAGRTAGLLAALLAATSVIHISESHSFRVDATMLFFVTLTWLFAVRIAEEGRWRDYVWAGVFAAASIASKYSAAFILGVIAVAHLAAPGRPALRDWRGWLRWTLRGTSPLAVCAATFALIDPLVFLYYSRFRQDVAEQITRPLTGAIRPIWSAQFTDVQPQRYWFTTNLWYGFGPAMEIWGLAGIAALVVRRTRAAIVAASFPVIYFLTAGATTTPMARYVIPLGPGLAVAAGALSALLFARPKLRRLGIVLTVVVVGTTTLYALAYMNIYRSRDARLAASRYLASNVPAGSRILVEPAHSIPPTGSYLRSPNFNGDYVLWGAGAHREDYYSLYGLDTYVYLFRGARSDDEKREYIRSRLALADYILMDDFYVQLYSHLPEQQHGVVKQYYRDLFAGRMGFDLVRTFKVYPSLFGVTINDDGAELSSRMNDHPRIYLFKRR